jgi:oligopeptide transport system substrate-binding protein
MRMFPIAAIAAAALLVALFRGASPDPPADFVFINRGDVSTLDLARISWQQDLRVARILHEGLVRNDVFSPDFAVVPAAAERWEISPDRRVYTFHLRHDARWSNGEPLKASDFVYSWRRGMIPDTGPDFAGFFFHITGAREFFDWRSDSLKAFAADTASLPEPQRQASAERLWLETVDRFDRTVGVKALDDRTLRVELRRPVAYFLSLLSFPSTFPVYPPLVTRHERLNAATGMMDTEQGWTLPPLHISNGPFRLAAWRFKRDMRLEKNPHYWNAESLAVDSILMPTVEDPNAQVLAFETGSVMWVTDAVARYIPEMLARKNAFYDEHRAEFDSLASQGLDQFEIDRRLPPDARKNIHVVPAFGTYFLNFNCRPTLRDGRPNPLRDPRLRRALVLAADRDVITREIRRMGEPASATLIPPNSIDGYASPPGLSHDVDAARKLLDDAGYPGGKGLPAIDYLFTRDGGHDLIAQALAQQWQRNLGITINLVPKEIRAFREDLKGKNYMISRASWFGDYGDPTTFLELNRTDDGNNDRDYSNPDYDALLDQAADETDPAARLALLSRAEDLLLRDAPILPLFQYNSVYLFNVHRFTGLTTHPRAEQNLSQIDVFGDGKGTDRPKTMKPRP